MKPSEKPKEEAGKLVPVPENNSLKNEKGFFFANHDSKAVPLKPSHPLLKQELFPNKASNTQKAQSIVQQVPQTKGEEKKAQSSERLNSHWNQLNSEKYPQTNSDLADIGSKEDWKDEKITLLKDQIESLKKALEAKD